MLRELEDLMNRRGALYRKVLGWIKAWAEGLGKCWDLNVVHLDMNTEYITSLARIPSGKL